MKQNTITVNLHTQKDKKNRQMTRMGTKIKSSKTISTKIRALLCATLLATGLPLHAQKDTITSQVDIAEVEISAYRTPVVYAKAGRTIEMVTRTAIDQMPVFSIDQVLDMMQQIDIRQRGPMGIQSDIGIRGGSFDQVLVLLNGVNISDPQTGHFNLNLPIDLSCVERIEVLEGPAARVYGPNAFSGAINFITGGKSNSNTTVNTTLGSHGLAGIAVGQTIQQKTWKSFLSASHNQSNGYVADTDFKSYNLFYQGQLQLTDAKLELQTGFNSKDYGALTFYSDKFPNQYEENRTAFASIQYTTGTKYRHTSQTYWRRNTDMFDLKRYDPTNNNNHHLTDVFGIKQNILIPWSMGKTSLGGELRSESVWSTTLGNTLLKPKPVPGSDASFTKWYNRNNAALFVEHIYQYNQLTITAGLLLNANSSLDWKFTLFPGADISYWLNHNTKLFASANKALRLPTFTDLFYRDPAQQGNPELRPEEAITYEGGVEYFHQLGSIKLGLYHQDAEQLIDWGKAPEETLYQSRNLSNMKSTGIQLSGNLDLTKQWGDGAWIQQIKVGYFYNTQNKKAEAGYESRFVMDYLKQKLVVGIQNRLPGRLMMGWNIRYQDRNGTFTPSGTTSATPYKPFWLTDLRLSRKQKYFTLYCEATNLFDNQYEDIANVPQPGIWVRGGINISIDYN